MNDFDYDVLQKKKLARMAKYKKGTQRTVHGKMMPWEKLTRKEVEALSGEVSKVNLHEPMSWESFKSLPAELKTEYIDWIICEFEVGHGFIGKYLFGISPEKIKWHFESNKLNVMSLGKGGRSTTENRKRFIEWCNSKKTAVPAEPVINIKLVDEKKSEDLNKGCLEIASYPTEFRQKTFSEEFREIEKMHPEWDATDSIKAYAQFLKEKKYGAAPKTDDQDAKNDEGKLKLTLVPPAIIKAIAAVRMFGTKKYADKDNWMKVSPDRYIDAVYRHFLEFMDDPMSRDEESNLPHLWHLACNVAFLCALLWKDQSNG